MYNIYDDLSEIDCTFVLSLDKKYLARMHFTGIYLSTDLDSFMGKFATTVQSSNIAHLR